MTKEDEDRLISTVMDLVKNVAIHQTFLFAMIDCLAETPGFPVSKFRILRKEYELNGLAIVQRQMKDAQEKIASLLKQFEGEPQ